jgi:hypothetical protein
MRLIETGSSTPYSLRAIQSYIFFFDQLQQSRTGGINTTYELQTQFIMDDVPPGNYYFQIKQRPNSAAGTLPTVTLDPQGTTKSYLQISEVKQAADGRIMEIAPNMPFGTNGIKLIDFLIGVQKKFNLVMYPSKTARNQFIVESFNNWYNTGRRWDFNKYVNLDEKIEVIPANNLAVNELNFGDSLDQDYVSQQFSKEANREYAKQYYVDTNNFFSQGKFDVKTTLASTPLLQIPGTGLSGSIQGLNPTINAFYVGNVKLSNQSVPQQACGIYQLYDVYTLSGQILQGETLYYDQYGADIVSNYNWVVDPLGLEIYELNNGVIGFGSGFFC